MQNIKFLILLIFLSSNPLWGAFKTQLNKLPYSNSLNKKIKNGRILTSSKVKTFEGPGKKKFQSLEMSTSGLHKKSCKYAMRKLSLYENYQDFLSYVDSSAYDEKKEVIFLGLSAPVLPIKFDLFLNIPRIKKEGSYGFSFNQGFLKGLKGKIDLANFKGRCFVSASADWKGPYTGYSSFIFKTFVDTILDLTLKKLFRISTTY
jgi:hypothetical protein